MLLLPAYSYTVVEITTNKGDNEMYNNYNITTKYLDCDESFSFEQNNDWEYAEEDDDERKYDAKEARHKDSDRKERCKKQRDKKEDEKERGRGKKPPLKPHERPIMTDKEVLATGSVYQLSGNRGMAASQASTNTASMYNASDEWMGSYTSSSTTSSQSANQEYSNQGASNCQWGQNCCCCARHAYQQGLREGYRRGWCACRRQNCCKCCGRNNTFGNDF